MMFHMLEEAAYDHLRTKEQLGYLAYSRMFNFRNILGGGVAIQSSKKSPEYMLLKTREFLVEKRAHAENLSDDEFKKGVHALLSIKKQVDVNLTDVRARMYGEVVGHTYNFERQQQSIEILESMIKDQESIDKNKEEILAHFKQTFQEFKFEEDKEISNFDHVKTLTLEMICVKQEEQANKDFAENSKNFRIERCPVKYIDHKSGPIHELKINTGKVPFSNII
jgi:secreted Zn-dependent insulinase-like peptidase